MVAVAPDAYVRQSKGRGPYWSQQQRAETVVALGVVDRVERSDSLSAASVIAEFRPRLFVKGPDWQDRLPDEIKAACYQSGTAIVFVTTPESHFHEAQDRIDAEALAALEATVQQQRTVTIEPWRAVTDYSFEARTAIEGPHPELIWNHLIDADATDVLDYGCGPQACLVRLLRDHHPETEVGFWGYDPQVDEQIPGTSRSWPIDGIWPYHLVICREVLEHCALVEITRVVSLLCEMANRVYVTTRFAARASHLLSVETADALDPTHISMLHPVLLRTLFVLEGFTRRADLEAKMDWKQLGRCLVYDRPDRA